MFSWLILLFNLICACNVPSNHLLASLYKPMDFGAIIKFTNALNEVHEIENFVIYSSRKHIKGENTLDQSLGEYFTMPTITWGRCHTVRHRNIIGRNGLAFVQFSSFEDPLLNAVERTLRDLHSMPILFILDQEADFVLSRLEMERFFVWCWDNYMLNVLLLVENTTQVYKYTPFPKIAIQNATALSLAEQVSFMAPRTLRVHGFNFYTPMFKLPPYTFMAPASADCKLGAQCPKTISGIGGRFYKEYIQQINGTISFQLGNTSFFSVHQLLSAMLKNKTIHIGIVPTSDLYVETAIAHGSYPIWHVNACVMVPYVPEIFYGDYVRRAFAPNVWLLVIVLSVALLILQAIHMLCGSLKHVHQHNRTLNYADPLTYAIGRLTNQPLSTADLNRHGSLYRALQLLMLFMCFVLVSMYTTTLTSLLSTTLFDRQINTLQEFLDSDLTLLVSVDQKRTLLDTGRLPNELLPKMKVTDWYTIAAQRRALNVSNAYMSSSDLWDYINLQQQRLPKPIFRLGGKELCTRQYFVKFSIRRDSPFMPSLTMFILFAHQSGLANKWNDMNTAEGVQIEYLKMFQRETSLWKPLQLKHYAWAFWIGLLLWIGAIICFLSEIIFYRWQSERQLFEFVH